MRNNSKVAKSIINNFVYNFRLEDFQVGSASQISQLSFAKEAALSSPSNKIVDINVYKNGEMGIK